MSHPRTRGRNRAVFIGRYFEIEFYLDYSWFFIATLISITLSANFEEVLDGQGSMVYAAMGIIGAALFFLSILLHELGHSLVSQRCGIPVPRITLMLIGGVAEIAREPDDARSELKIALGGPAVSVVLVILYFAFGFLFDWLDWEAASAVALWLAMANLFLVIFNMIPGYPLDGGRVLRAILWARSGKLRQSTFITSRIGIAFSGALVLTGLFLILNGRWNGLILFIIAIFLKRAAESGYANAVERDVLAGVVVQEIMTPHPITLSPRLPLNIAIDEVFLTGHHLVYPVCSEENEFLGFLSVDDLLTIAPEKRPYTTVGDLLGDDEPEDAMIPADAPAGLAMRILLRSPLSARLAVVDQGKLAGILTHRDMLQFIKLRSKLEEPRSPGDFTPRR